MKSEEARNLTFKANTEAKENQYLKITTKIKQEAESGKDYIWFYEIIRPDVIQKLIDEGYIVEETKHDRNESLIKIKWESNHENIRKGIYVGNEFPDYFGLEIEIMDDYSQENAPCYQIRFVGESQWHDNMDDSDIKFK